LVELFVFNGTLYFENIDEQTAYCEDLCLCPKPQTKTEEEAFEIERIADDELIRCLEHRRHPQIRSSNFLHYGRLFRPQGYVLFLALMKVYLFLLQLIVTLQKNFYQRISYEYQL
jgi:hypothetical protein